MYKWLNPDSHLLHNMCMCTCVYSYIHIYIYAYICGISSHTLVEPTCSSNVLVETHTRFPHSCGNPQYSSHILVGTHIQFPQLVPTILWSVTMGLGTTRQMTRWLWIHAQGKGANFVLVQISESLWCRTYRFVLINLGPNILRSGLLHSYTHTHAHDKFHKWSGRKGRTSLHGKALKAP